MGIAVTGSWSVILVSLSPAVYGPLSDIIEFRGSMIDCPETLHSGADLIVSLSVYIKASAFKSLKADQSEGPPKAMFNEGQETAAEQSLRERKGSLIHLFKVLDLKPQRGDSLLQRQNGDLSQSDLVKLTQHPSKPGNGKNAIKTEIVGDGEEIEVEADGEELNENELSLIYKKCNKFSPRFVISKTDFCQGAKERQHNGRA